MLLKFQFTFIMQVFSQYFCFVKSVLAQYHAAVRVSKKAYQLAQLLQAVPITGSLDLTLGCSNNIKDEFFNRDSDIWKYNLLNFGKEIVILINWHRANTYRIGFSQILQCLLQFLPKYASYAWPLQHVLLVTLLKKDEKLKQQFRIVLRIIDKRPFRRKFWTIWILFWHVYLNWIANDIFCFSLTILCFLYIPQIFTSIYPPKRWYLPSIHHWTLLFTQ